MLQLSADRAHRHPLDGAGPAPRRQPLDPGGPRRCHRYRAQGHHRGGPDRPGGDLAPCANGRLAGGPVTAAERHTGAVCSACRRRSAMLIG